MERRSKGSPQEGLQNGSPKRGNIVLVSVDGKRRTVVPRYEEIKPGTLLSIIDQAGLTKEELIRLLD